MNQLINQNNINHFLWFSAPWCKPCKKLNKMLEIFSQSNKSINQSTNIYKINIDELEMDLFDSSNSDNTFECTLLNSISKIPTFIHVKNKCEYVNSRYVGADEQCIMNILNLADLYIASSTFITIDEF